MYHKVVDELEVSWDDNVCKLIHKKCPQKNSGWLKRSYMTLNSIFMPPPYLTLAKPKSWLWKHGLHIIDII